MKTHRMKYWWRYLYKADTAANSELKKLAENLEQADKAAERWGDIVDPSGDDTGAWAIYRALSNSYWKEREKLRDKLLNGLSYLIGIEEAEELIDDHWQELKRWIDSLPGERDDNRAKKNKTIDEIFRESAWETSEDFRNNKGICDGVHLVADVGLKDGAVLHRFKNPAGDKCSAVYIGNNEIIWHYREREQDMVEYWNDQGRLD